MQRALVWLNLYGREDVQHKLKNSLKTQKMHSLPEETIQGWKLFAEIWYPVFRVMFKTGQNIALPKRTLVNHISDLKLVQI